MNVLSKTALAAAFLLGCGVAQATNTDWSVRFDGDLLVEPRFVPHGSFEDTYSFELVSSLIIEQSSAVTANNTPKLHISNGSYSLFNMGGNGLIGGGDDVLVEGAFTFDGTTGSTMHQVALGVGKFYFDVKGLADGTKGGFYTLTSTVVAVPIPEPEIYAMMAAGLGLMGFVARRRQQRKD